MRRRIDQWRLLVFLGITLGVFVLIGYRLFTIAYVRHGWYASAARSHAEHASTVMSRGAILMGDEDAELTPVATNKRFAVATLNAYDLDDVAKERAVMLLVQVAHADAERVRRIADDGQDLAIPVGEYLSAEQVASVSGRALAGVEVVNVMDRFYPDGSLAADTIGFFGHDPDGRHGQYGVEAYYETELSGVQDHADEPIGKRWFGALLGSDPASSDVPVPSDVVLTMDRTVQAYVEGVLRETMERFGAAAGSAIVQEVTTGKIIAMADSPSYDPNRYGQAPPAAFLNAPSQVPFEPGSSFKPFTMAIGLDARAVTPEDTFTDTGPVTVAGHTIRNFREELFGTVDMAGILENSINTGTMHVQERTGDETFLSGLINFGFGQQTGIDLPGEATGNLENLYSGRKINYLTASFGQGITVTPLQLATGYSAIANGGKVMRPYVVDRIVREGAEVSRTEPEVVAIPISSKTAAQVRAMLVSVVDNGFDKARIARYDVAGKTGTAQIADPEGGYLEDEYTHSFAGFVPGLAPRFTIVLIIERPRGVTFASDSLSPVFRDIATFLINYYRIAPTR